ncbi:MAG: hypothetical protein DRR42_28110, partial [Gammaproteobacteria bacterium]
MRGPAFESWKDAFPGIETCSSLDSTLQGVELVITGTGWGSDIEHEARVLARARGIRSVAVIDHWVNYEERFIRQGTTVWPDEFWVTDDYAMEIAKRTFPEQAILKVPNCYVDRQLSAIKHVKKPERPELLYILEPIRSEWGKSTPGEFQALDYFISCLPHLELPPATVINLRPHPSDSRGKYNKWVAAHSTLNIHLDSSLSIAQSLGRSSWVAG